MTEPRPLALEGAEKNRLAGELWGLEGRPVVFLHGGGQTRHAWHNTARRVAASGMRAVTLDLRGHGDSDWVASGNYTFDHFAQDAAAVARQVAEQFGRPPAVVGASLGGMSALLAELGEGPLMESLVLVDVTPRMDMDGVARILGFMNARMKEGFATFEEAADAIAAYLPHRRRPASLEGLGKNLRLGEDGRYRWHWDPAFFTSPRNINHGAIAAMEGVIAALPRLSTPVLLVRGMRSELVPEAFAREFVELAPRASYVDVGGAGHMVAGDRNDAFCAAILEFLAERESTA